MAHTLRSVAHTQAGRTATRACEKLNRVVGRLRKWLCLAAFVRGAAPYSKYFMTTVGALAPFRALIPRETVPWA